MLHSEIVPTITDSGSLSFQAQPALFPLDGLGMTPRPSAGAMRRADRVERMWRHAANHQDRAHLSQRAYDDCFEMGDGDVVAHILGQRLSDNGDLRRVARSPFVGWRLPAHLKRIAETQ